MAAILLAGTHSCPDERFCMACYQMDDKHACLACSNSYFDDKAGKCSQDNLVEVPNCLTYIELANQISCVGCHLGFFKNDEGKCETCPIAGCAVCDDGVTCEACFNNRKLNSDKNICEKDISSGIQHCEVFGIKGKEDACYACSNGFALDQSGKSYCIKSVDNCLMADPIDSLKCGVCTRGYYITSSGKCHPDKGGFSFIFYLFAIVFLGTACFVFYQHYIKRRPDDVYAATFQ